MSDLIEYIEDLETLDSLDTVSREAHLEFLISKYKDRFSKEEAELEKQYDLFQSEF